ncbi:MAG: protein kinase [Candidatus Brocadiaceae bacterium]|nr:protein kinase [Candidatus Brocadiaceae bacterium]
MPEQASTPEGLRRGSVVGGLTLADCLTTDQFSSLWLARPPRDARPDTCIRAIPVANLQTPRAQARLTEELTFWQDLSGRCAVDLYDRRPDRRHYVMVMRYIPGGSLADHLGDADTDDRIEHLALDFASALRELHGATGAHGNLKPSNVFALPGGGVLFSDFAIGLWADEWERGCSALEPHLIHPYQDPQQRANVRDFDTRSDVYAFGRILQHLHTGVQPDLAAPAPPIDESRWPGRLGSIVQRCLAPERADRPADGFELFDVLSSSIVLVVGDGPAGPAFQDTPARETDPGALREEASRLSEEGRLAAALDILESLPPDTEGVTALIDEIERRHQACETLLQEAVSLAEMGKPESALDTIARAESLCADSDTLLAIKADLAVTVASTARETAASAEDVAAPREALPQPLVDALESERYPVARTHLETFILAGPLSDEGLAAVARFRKGRMHRAFCDSIAEARRLYVLGYRRKAGRAWLEAAAWLPNGPERSRLRAIAAAAERGTLVLDVDALGLADLPPGEAAARFADARPLRPLLVAVAVILVLAAALLLLTTCAGN